MSTPEQPRRHQPWPRSPSGPPAEVGDRRGFVALRELIEASALVRESGDLPRALQAIADALASAAGINVVVNLHRPEWDDFVASAVHGSAEMRESLLGATYTRDYWTLVLDERFVRHGAYVIRAGDLDWSALPGAVYWPPIPPSHDPLLWQADDAIFIPFHGRAGNLLGIFCLLEPESGLLPTDDELELLSAVARHAGSAVQIVQDAAAAARQRAALRQLLEVSQRLTDTSAPDPVLQAISDGIASALSFQRVSVELVDSETGLVMPRAVTGWGEDEELAGVQASADQLKPLFDPRFERHGCFLLEHEDGLRLLGSGNQRYSSKMNGRGPLAWQNHWLVVPLYRPNEDLLGVIWIDEPEDRLLPSDETLQALRTFANQATAAIESAAQFEQLRLASETQQALIRSSPLAIVVLDGSGRMLVVNHAAEVLVDCASAEMVGLPFERLPGASGLAGELLARLRGGLHYDGDEVRLPRSRQEVLALRVWSSPLRDTHDRPSGFVLVFEDIRERRRLEASLRQAQKLESLGLLAGGIAHDFNNALQALLGNALLAESTLPADAPAAELLAEIRRAAERLASLTEKMVAYTGRGTFARDKVDAVQVVTGAVEAMRSTAPRGADFALEVDRDSPAVRGDSEQIRQLVLNLLVNAAESLPKQGGVVTVRLRPFELERPLVDPLVTATVPAGSFLALEVEDEGHGMDERTLARSFDPFFSTRFAGRGLGLAVVLGVVRGHGGSITVDSTPGHGTRIRVLLPAWRA
ncbi:MAG: ATP-binding protein [Gaiellaceae bacterium]